MKRTAPDPDGKSFGFTRRRCLAAVAAGLSVLGAPGVTRARSEIWTMVGMDEFPPYNQVRNGRFVGVDIDILTEAARRLGVVMDFVPLPWRRALLAPGMGEADGLFQLTPTPERYRHWLMTGPLRQTRIVFVVLAESPLRDFSKLDDLQGLSVGVVDGFSYTPGFDLALNFQHEGSVDDETSLRKLLLRRADVVVGGEANLRYMMQKLAVSDRVRILPTALDVQGRYVGFPRTAAGQDKSDRLGAVLARMDSDGQIATILQRRLGR